MDFEASDLSDAINRTGKESASISNLLEDNDELTEEGQDLLKNTELFKAETVRVFDTPLTLLLTGGQNYDITIFCQQCLVYVDVCRLQYHRAYHNALTTLQYTTLDRPTDTFSLLLRRNQLIKVMKDEAVEKHKLLSSNQFRKIDEAYEILKNDLFDINIEFAKLPNSKLDTDVQSFFLKCSVDFISGVGFATSKNSTWKTDMEDVCVYQDFFGEDRDKCYLGLFDGYHGSNAALKSGQKLHEFLLKEMAKFDSKTKSTEARNFAKSTLMREDYETQRPETRASVTGSLHQESKIYVENIINSSYKTYSEQTERLADCIDVKENRKFDPFSEQMKQAFKTSYNSMDNLLAHGVNERSKVRWSGTSAVTCVLQKTQHQDSQSDFSLSYGKIYMANVGKAKALLVRGNKPVCITKDHIPSNIHEIKRVKKKGGFITTSEKGPLVNGVLPVTRGLGNFGDKLLKECVIEDPYFRSLNIDEYSQYLVLASSGVWQVFSNEEVASLLTKMLPSQYLPPPSRTSESILPLLTSRDTDDKTADIVKGQHFDPVIRDLQAGEGRGSPADQENLSQKEEVVCLENSSVPENAKPESPQQIYSDSKLELAKAMAKQLTIAALLAGATENVSVMVALFPGFELRSHY